MFTFIQKSLRTESLYYKGNWFHRKGMTGIGKSFTALNKIFNGCDINCKADIGKGLHVAHAIGLVIGGKIKIGDNCTIYHNITIGKSKGFCPHIGNNVTIYPHTIIAGNITIPDGSVIPAKSTLITKRPSIWNQKVKKLTPINTKDPKPEQENSTKDHDHEFDEYD